MIKQRIAAAALTLSAAALVGLAVSEGYEPVAKPPIAGDVPTVGFGATQGVRQGETTTPVRALVRLLDDADQFQRGVQRCVKVPLYQHEFDAYVRLAYNVGVGAFCGSTLVRKLNAGNYAGACAEISRWDRFRGKPLPGLTTRRAAERALCEGRS